MKFIEKRKIFGFAALGLSLLLLAHGCATQPGARVATATTATKNPEVIAAHGMVATAHKLASQAGLEMLQKGGNAVDAAVAAAFAIGVVEPNNSGLGGEGILIVYRADLKKAFAVDYRSMAPAKAKFKSSIPKTGHVGVAVPGMVAGMVKALNEFGTLKLPQVMAPAIKYAEEGFVISPVLAGDISDSFEEVQKNEALAAILCPQGLPLEAGATLKNPDLGKSLRKISAGGADVFYRGEIADAIAADMAKHRGFITKEDLAAYRAIVREPVHGSYRGYEVISAPPPVGGLAVVEILQMFECFDLTANPPLSPRNVHLMAEAMKRGFADHSAYVADPEFVKVPIQGLLAPDYAKKRAADIVPERMSTKVVSGEPVREGSGSTTTLCAVDKDGNIAVLTQTISDHMGAKVAVPGTGIFLNNEMKNFSTRGVNTVAPHKRMRGTQAPTILLKDGKPYATLGTPGSGRIISTMAIMISNLIDHHMSIQEAIESPRFYARDTEQNVSIEARMPKATVDALKGMGYTFTPMNEYDLFFGGAQGIVIDRQRGRLIGGADPRRDGTVLGY